MKTFLLACAVLLLSSPAWSAFCALTGESVSGLNKICYYSCPSGTVAITISNVGICPVSIDR